MNPALPICRYCASKAKVLYYGNGHYARCMGKDCTAQTLVMGSDELAAAAWTQGNYRVDRQEPKPVICDYCSKPAHLLLHSGSLYHGTDYGPVWHCAPCKAWVGTHKNSERFAPLGRLANPELRAAKQLAHEAFDPLWRGKMRRDGCSKKQARSAAYSWLAAQLNIKPEECHIGMMDVERCMATRRVCQAIGR